jgi:N-acyl homoserine lactone hydrolase
VSLTSPTATWTVTALDTGTSVIEHSTLTYLTHCGEAIRIPRVIWVLEGPTTIIVDTSVPRVGDAPRFVGEHFTRDSDQEPSRALQLAGVDPSAVEYVILTHLHWDHAGNCDLFPYAKIIVQDKELRYALAPPPFFAKAFLAPLSGWPRPPYLLGNLVLIDGERTVAPGVRIVPAPGHTPGSQAVLANTAAGTICIAGDAVMSFANLAGDIPPGFHCDVDASIRSMQHLRECADSILPSHDYAIFSGGSRIATFPSPNEEGPKQ